HSLEFRLHLRHEFLMLGILQVVERLRSSSPEGDGSALGDHLDLFEMMRQEDEQEMRSLSDSGSASPIDFESPSGMAEVLTQRLDNTLALPHLVSLFQHLLMVPTDERHLPLWRLFDLVLQQLTLQSAMGGLAPHGADPQFGQIPLRLDMDDLLARLNTQQDCERLERKLRETERELEGERRRLMELENRLSDLQDGVSLASFSRVSEHSASSSPSDPCHSPTPFCRSSALPPIRPPKNLAPPPPPPSALQLRSFGAIPSSSSAAFSSSLSMKIVPKPKCTLKTLNWKQIPADQIQGTIWENIEDDRLYKQIDMEEICEQFVAGRGTGDEIAAEGLGTMQRSRPLLRQLEQISVVEPRRAQNCTIMLSRLKLSHREIRQIVLAMDERAKLPRDMIEQMLKFVPSKNELQLIREALSQQRKSASSLALADRFLWEMGQIPRYDQRLKCLHTIRSFNECLGVLRPALNGFSVFSLDEIPTVRSSSRPERNLMHFLVELAEQKFPELLRLKRELGAVSEAAKVNRNELEAELHQLQRSIRELAAELNVHERVIDKGTDQMTTADSPNSERTSQQQNRGGGDRFIPVVRAFLETATREMDELRAEHRAMAEKFSECARFFAATDPKKGDPSPDAFFCTFSRCLNTFAECYGAIWAEREELERTKRQTLARTVNSRKGLS
uniref:FH2 domain-containing protein n=1 Tax=Globodera pallida TaxID=36090 RepID=A0A183CPR0_GLOPA